MNVIVICNDTFRRDHLGCYGNSWIRTPNLDELAAQSAVFEQYYVASYPTIPNRWDVYTGRYGFPFRGWEPIGSDDVTLSEMLSKHGYTTMQIFDMPGFTFSDFNYHRGFDGYWFVRGQMGDRYMTDPEKPATLPAQPHKLREGMVRYIRNQSDRRHEREYTVGRVATAAMDWLETNYKLDRFFLWVDMWDPHEPFDPPWYDHDLYGDPNYSGDRILRPAYGRPSYMTVEEMEEVRALYAGQVTQVDRWVGYLLETIEKLGLFKNTLVIWTTDHGHLFGEHDLQGKPGGQLGNLYEVTARIPLLVRHPGGMGSGTRVQGLAQPPDLLPTILEALEIPVPEHVEGESLWPLVEGQTEQVRRYAFSGGRFSPEVRGLVVAPAPGVGALFDGWAGSSRNVEAITVTDSEWALVASPLARPSELYHISKDPEQKQNVIKEHPHIAEEMRSALLSFLQDHGAVEDRLRPFREVTHEPGATESQIFYAFRDDHGRRIAFPTEAEAKSNALDPRGGPSRPIEEITFGDLLADDPKTLVHAFGQCCWAQDLV